MRILVLFVCFLEKLFVFILYMFGSLMGIGVDKRPEPQTRPHSLGMIG